MHYMLNSNNQIAMETPPLSSFRQGNQIIQEHDAIFDYQSKIVSLRQTFFMMLLSMTVMLLTQIVIETNFMQEISFFNPTRFFTGNYWLSLLGLTITISIVVVARIQPRFKGVPFNLMAWSIFTAAISLTGVSLVSDNSIWVMISCVLMGQVLSQFLSANQVKIEMTIQQSIFYVSVNALIVFQLFIVYTDAPFFEMVVVIIIGIVFGFFLVLYVHIQYLQQPNKDDSVWRSVTIYAEVFLLFENLPRMIQQILLKERRIIPAD